MADRISEDREYSPILRESFISEMAKLEDQKSDILRVSVSQVSPQKPQSKEMEVSEITESPVMEAPALEKKKIDKQIRKY